MEPFTIAAPAKVNLALGVSPHIIDGKHQLQSIFCTLALVDGLTVEYDEQGTDELEFTIEYSGDVPHLDIAPEQNLVVRAVRLMQEEFGTAAAHKNALGRRHALGGHLHLHLYKNIPAQAGLGGGSSDAAAAIMALALLWGADRLDPRCLHAARQLGADVSFFLYGGCASMAGDGSDLVRTLAVPKLHLVCARPNCGVNTAAAYAAFDSQATAVGDIDALARLLANNADHAGTQARAVSIAAALTNNLEPAVFGLEPQVAKLYAELAALPGALKAVLCGSGSAVFAVMQDAMSALQAVMHFREQGLWAVSTMTQ
jgi:4-diphosphocytidyl-2-C-methyl-D-erythritol kinase